MQDVKRHICNCFALCVVLETGYNRDCCYGLCYGDRSIKVSKQTVSNKDRFHFHLFGFDGGFKKDQSRQQQACSCTGRPCDTVELCLLWKDNGE